MKTLLCLLALCANQEPEPVEAEVELLATGLGFTEGPVWLPDEEALVFSDIPASKLMRWSESTGVTVLRASENANGNSLDLEGRLLSCQHGARNIVRFEKDGSSTVVVDSFEGKRLNSPNDVAVQSDGTLWFTDPPWGLENLTVGKELAGNWVFRVAPDGEVAVVIRDLLMPNGIALSPDERHLYVADTGGLPWFPDPEQRDVPATLSAYELGDGNELSAEPVWRVETLCDGMCVDAVGNIYASGAKGVSIWKPDGEELGLIPVPEQPANMCFGGKDFSTLFITARTSLYSVQLDVAGNKPKNAKW